MAVDDCNERLQRYLESEYAARDAEAAALENEALSWQQVLFVDPVETAAQGLDESIFGTPLGDSAAYDRFGNSIESSLTQAMNFADPTGLLSLAVTGKAPEGVGLFDPVSKFATARAAAVTNKPCVQGIIQSTIGAVSQSVGAVTADVFRASRSLGLAVAHGLSTVESFGAALGALPLQDLLALLTSRASKLQQIRAVLSKMDSAIDFIAIAGQQAYLVDQQALLLEVLRELRTADFNLSGLENLALRGGEVSRERLDAEVNRIGQVQRALLRYGQRTLTPGTLPDAAETPRDRDIANGVANRLLLATQNVQVQLLTRALSGQNTSLTTMAARLADLGNVVGGLRAKTPNLLAPFLRQMRCQLTSIIQEMEDTIRQNNYITYLTRRMEWATELRTLIGLSRAYRQLFATDAQLGSNDGVAPGRYFRGLQAETKLADTLDGLLGPMDSATLTKRLRLSEYAVIIQQVTAVTQLVGELVSRFVEVAPIKQAIADTIVVIDTELAHVQSPDSFTATLAQVNDSILANPAVPVDFVLQVLSWFSEGPDSAVTELFGDARWEEALFGGPAAVDKTTSALRCIDGMITRCRASGVKASQTTIGDLLTTQRLLQGRQRENQFAARLSEPGAWTKTYMDRLTQQTFPALDEMLPRLERLKGAPCLGLTPVVPRTTPNPSPGVTAP